jgi:hypothetical protein
LQGSIRIPIETETDFQRAPLCIGTSWMGTDSKLVADVPVSALQTKTAQLEATIRSAHALLQAGLIGEGTSLLAAFSTRDDLRWLDLTKDHLNELYNSNLILHAKVQ